MGLMDKFKNLFTDEEIIDEEEDEVEIKEVKKEEPQKLPTFMREKIEKEEKEKTPKMLKIKDDEETDIKKEIKLEKEITSESEPEEKSFKFPIDFNEDDFTETRGSRESLHRREIQEEKPVTKNILAKEDEREKKIAPRQQKKELKVAEIYKDKKEEKPKKEEKKFRATPIISPIYGVLDKNYDPEDVENNKGHNLEDTRPSKSVDFDSVRKKAYGSLSDEIKENLMCENCEYLKEAKECREKHERNDLSQYEKIDDDFDSEYENITLDEATENYYDYGVEYEKKKKTEDNYYLDDDENEVKITNHETEEEPKKKNEIPPVKNSINLLSTLKKSMGNENEEEPPKGKNLELTDDLFNLIDSMYDERNDSE